MTQTGKTKTHTDKLLDLTQQFPQAFWDPIVRTEPPESVPTPESESAPTPESLRPVEIESPIHQRQTETTVNLGQIDSAASHGQTMALNLDDNEVLPLSSPSASPAVEVRAIPNTIDPPNPVETSAPSEPVVSEPLHSAIEAASEPAQPQPVQPPVDPLAQEAHPMRHIAYPPRSGRSMVDAPMDTGLQALMGTFPDAFNSPTSTPVADSDTDSVEAQQPEPSEQETIILPVEKHEEEAVASDLPTAIANHPDTTPDASPAPLTSETSNPVSENTELPDAHDFPGATSSIIATDPVTASVEGTKIAALANDDSAQVIVNGPEQYETLPTSTNQYPEQESSEGSATLVLPSKDYDQALQRHLQTMTWGQIEVYLTYGQQGLKSIWITVGKSGTEVQSLCEAITRLINLLLAHQVPIATICRQIRGIRGADSEGFGPHRVLGLADLIGKALQEAPEQYPAAESAHPVTHGAKVTPPPLGTSTPTESQTIIPAQESTINPAELHPSAPERTAPSDQTEPPHQAIQASTSAAALSATSPSPAPQAWLIPDHNSLTAMLCPECGAELQHMNGCSGGACPVCGFSSCS